MTLQAELLSLIATRPGTFAKVLAKDLHISETNLRMRIHRLRAAGHTIVTDRGYWLQGAPTMNLPYVIIVSDGINIRTLHRPAFSAANASILDKIVEATIFPMQQAPPATPLAIARERGYEGDPCPNCGEFRLKRSGHCFVCDSCGETTGCS